MMKQSKENKEIKEQQENKTNANETNDNNTKLKQLEQNSLQLKTEIRFYERWMINILKQGDIPKHIAFIMDGNRRYAQSLGLDKTEGHFSGFISFKRCCEWCYYLGVKEMTVFAFAIENFNRSKQEVDVLMNLAQNSLRKLADEGSFLHENQIRVKICGDLSILPQSVQVAMKEMETLTEKYNNLLLNICFAYNSTYEIDQLALNIKQKVENKEIDINKLDIQTVKENLIIKTNPDIVIRTSNEIRLSNFLTFQSTNAQIMFIQERWPEISIFSIVKIIIQYQLNLRKQKQIQKLIQI